jgi:hypothetical protein
MSDALPQDFSLLSDDELAALERSRRIIADEEWKAAYRDGQLGRNRPPPPPSPPLSLALIAHFAYLDRLIGGIRELDTAASEQRIRRAHRLLKGGRR